MEEKELSIASISRIRTALLVVGTVIGYLSFLPSQLALAYSMLTVSICMSVYGCYLWARLKGRSELWMLMGLFAPLGFLALALLKDRSKEPTKL